MPCASGAGPGTLFVSFCSPPGCEKSCPPNPSPPRLSSWGAEAPCSMHCPPSCPQKWMPSYSPLADEEPEVQRSEITPRSPHQYTVELPERMEKIVSASLSWAHALAPETTSTSRKSSSSPNGMCVCVCEHFNKLLGLGGKIQGYAPTRKDSQQLAFEGEKVPSLSEVYNLCHG